MTYCIPILQYQKPKRQLTWSHLKLFECSLNVLICPSHVELRRESWWTFDFPYLQRIRGNMCAISQWMLRNLEKCPTCDAVSPWGFTNSLASCWNSLDLFRYLLDSVATQSALVLQSSHDISWLSWLSWLSWRVPRCHPASAPTSLQSIWSDQAWQPPPHGISGHCKTAKRTNYSSWQATKKLQTFACRWYVMS